MQINVLYEGVTLSHALLIKDHMSLYPAHSVILIETHHIDLVKAESRPGEKWKGFGEKKGKGKEEEGEDNLTEQVFR